MISIDLGTIEEFDDTKSEFIYHEGGIVRFEYTLKAVYEWEGKWKKPFLKTDMTPEESVDFYKRMALDPISDMFITNDVMMKLKEYISDPRTATVFSNNSTENAGKGGSNGKVFTAEEIYATMFSYAIPLEFEDRNLNRLLTVIRIIKMNNEPPKKMSKQDVLRQNQSLNAQRKAMLKTKG